MTIRQLVCIVAAVLLLVWGRETFGDTFLAPYFATLVLAVGAAWLAVWLARARLRQWFRRADADTQERVLVNLEAFEFRVELADEAPHLVQRVPLRGERESFRYPEEHVRVIRWIRNCCLFLALFLLLGWASDALLGRSVFVGPQTSWWDALGPSALLGACAAAMWWSELLTRSTIEVTEAALVQRLPARAPREIPWPAVTSARRSATGRYLTVASPTHTIRVGDGVIGYGRLVNLVATRLPASARWDAS